MILLEKEKSKRTISRKFLMLGVFIFVSISSLFSILISNAAIPPSIITYQGRLLNDGVAVTTTKAIAYVLFDDATAGNVLYTAAGTVNATSTVTTTLSDGFFTINLGDAGTNALDPVIFKNNDEIYLQITVEGQSLSPRKRITASPFAINAKYLDGVAATSTPTTSQYIPMSDTAGNFDFNGVTSSLLSVTGNSSFNTITSGTWNGSIISQTYGGTGTSTFSSGGVVFSDGTKLTQNINNLFWNNASSKLGVGTSSPQTRLHVYDGTLLVDGPVNPTVSGTYVPSSGWDVFVSKKYAYIVGLFGLKIVDISDSSNPSGVGSLDTGSGDSVYVSGEYAYVNNTLDDEMKIIDISNPTTPILIGNWVAAGDVGGVYVSGKYAYVADGAFGLKIIDISNPALPLEIGVFNTDGSAKNVFVSGKYAYVSDGNAGFAIVDISNPSSPSAVSSLNISGDMFTENVSEIYVSGKYAYVANGNNGMSIVDISNPLIPDLISTIAGNFVGVNISGKYAYLPGTNNIKIVDVSSPASLVLVSSLNISDTSRLFISGKYAYVVGGAEGLKIIDIKGANISSAEIGNISANNLTVWESMDVGNNLQVRNGLSVGANGLLSSGPVAINVSSTSAADILFSVGTHTTSSILSITGDGEIVFDNLNVTGMSSLATSTITNSTIGTLSVTNSTTISNLLTVTAASTFTGTTTLATTSISNLTIPSLSQGSIIYAGAGGLISGSSNLTWTNANSRFGISTAAPEAAVHVNGGDILQTTNGNVTWRGSVLLGGGGKLHVSGKYAYVADGRVVDISLASSPSVVATLPNLNSARDVFVSGNYVYVADSAAGLKIIDVSNPQTPSFVGGVDSENAWGIYVSGRYAYLADGEAGLKIIDVSNPQAPLIVGSIDTESAMDVYQVGKYAYVADYTNGLRIIDVSNPLSPIITGTLDTTGNSWDIYVSGKYAYVADGLPGLRIINILNPSAPSLTATVDTTDARAVYVSGKIAYVADFGSGLRMINISVPASASIVGTAGAGQSAGVYVSGKYAYVGAASLYIVDINGIDAPSLSVGNISTSNLTITENVDIANNLYIRNGLNIGPGGLMMNGDFAMSGSVTNTLSFNTTTLFKTSATSTVANAFIFEATNIPSSTTQYLLSVRSSGGSVFSVSSNGDVRASGTLYAVSATVGTPGSPGDLAERVDIALDDTVEAGDVVIVDPVGVDTYRRSNGKYDQAVAGVISTNPTIVVGDGKTTNTAVMAMVGRVPVKVSAENGSIKRGDLLVTASKKGYAMRYDSTKDSEEKIISIIGVALDEYSENSEDDKIMALVRTGWVSNSFSDITSIKQDLQKIAEAEGVQLNSSVENLTVNNSGGQISYNGGNLDLQGNSLLNVQRLVGKNNVWSIDEFGLLTTRYSTSEGDKEMYAIQSPVSEFIFSSSSQLISGEVKIMFDQSSKEIIDFTQPLKINITLTSGEAKGIFISEKSSDGFVVKELESGTSGATFDWIVVAKRKNIEIDSDIPSVSSPDEVPVLETLPTAENVLIVTSTEITPEVSSLDPVISSSSPVESEPAVEQILEQTLEVVPVSESIVEPIIPNE